MDNYCNYQFVNDGLYHAFKHRKLTNLLSVQYVGFVCNSLVTVLQVNERDETKTPEKRFVNTAREPCPTGSKSIILPLQKPCYTHLIIGRRV